MFSSIKAKNFLSWADLEFTFKPGITQLVGWNFDDNKPEGAGKTTLLNALCWCLFGAVPKDLKVDEVLKQGEKTVFTEVTLENGSTIYRSRSPNKLQMTLADGAVVKGKDAKETQKLIEAHIGLTFETFCSSVYFAQNYPKRFITATEEEKAKILSELQDLDQFDKARKIAMDKAKAAQNALDIEATSYSNLENRLSMYLEQSRSIVALKDKAVADQLSRLGTAEKEKADLQNMLEKALQMPNCAMQYEEEAQELTEALKTLQERKQEVLIKRAEHQRDLTQAEDLKRRISEIAKRADKKLVEIRALTGQNSPICPTCGTELSDRAKLQAHIDSLRDESSALLLEITGLKSQLSSIPSHTTNGFTEKLKELSDTIDTVAANIDKAQNAQRSSARLNESIAQYNRQIANIEARIKAESTLDLAAYDTQLADIKKAVNSLIDEKAKKAWNLINLKETATRYEILKEGFKELKSHVFRSVLSELSYKANTYLQKFFTMPVRLQMDNISSDGDIAKIVVKVTIDGVERPLAAYSGGQSALIYLSVDLALSDIIATRSGKPINLLILDEVLKGFSQESMEIVIDVLANINKSVILIEHSPLVQSIIHQQYFVEHREGTSRFK